MLKAGNLSHLIKELKQNSGKDQAKAAKKGETSGKDKPLAILMVQPWKKVVKQRITQTFSPKTLISFPPLGEEDGTKGYMIIEAERGGTFCPLHWRNNMAARANMAACEDRPGVRRIQAVPSISYGMLKFSVTGRTVTLRRSKIIPLECTMVSGLGAQQPVIDQVMEEKIR
ncbi:hypothetical protein Tco_1330666 [Tanacetum coccineum]